MDLSFLNGRQIKWKKCAIFMLVAFFVCGLSRVDAYDLSKCVNQFEHEGKTRLTLHGDCKEDIRTEFEVNALDTEGADTDHLTLTLDYISVPEIKSVEWIDYSFGNCNLVLILTPVEGEPPSIVAHGLDAYQVKIPFAVRLFPEKVEYGYKGKSPEDIATVPCKPFGDSPSLPYKLEVVQGVPHDSKLLLMFEENAAVTWKGPNAPAEVETTSQAPTTTQTLTTTQKTTTTQKPITTTTTTKKITTTQAPTTSIKATKPPTTAAKQTTSQVTTTSSTLPPTTSSSTELFTTEEATSPAPLPEKPIKQSGALSGPMIGGIVAAVLLVLIAVICVIVVVCVRRWKAQQEDETQGAGSKKDLAAGVGSKKEAGAGSKKEVSLVPGMNIDSPA